MKAGYLATALLLTAIPVGAALADSAGDLAVTKHCTACHDPEVETIGPPFRYIARQYKGMPNAKLAIARIIQTGSSGTTQAYHWSALKMPPPDVRVPVNPAEAAILADYVLSFQ